MTTKRILMVFVVLCGIGLITSQHLDNHPFELKQELVEAMCPKEGEWAKWDESLKARWDAEHANYRYTKWGPEGCYRRK